MERFQDDPNRAIVPFTEVERQQKREADDFYRHGDYQRAITIVLSMMRLNPQLQNDPGCIGLIMHCYHKLQDWENTVIYGCRKLELTEERDSVAHSITAVAFYNMGNFDRAFYHMSQNLELENNSGSALAANLRIAIHAGTKTKRWQKIVPYIRRYIELDPNNLGILQIGLNAAEKSGQFTDRLYFAECLLATQGEPWLLTIAMRAAWACKNAAKTLEYAERLIIQAEVTGCEEFLVYAKRAAQELGDEEKVRRYSFMLRAAQGLRLA